MCRSQLISPAALVAVPLLCSVAAESLTWYIHYAMLAELHHLGRHLGCEAADTLTKSK